MPVTSSDRALAAALVALAAGCVTREIEVHPFALTATVGSGAPLPIPPQTQDPVVLLGGVAHVAGPTTLVVATGTEIGDVTLAFDGAAAPGAAFPAQLEGAGVNVEILATDFIHAPDGRVLPYPGLRIATGPPGDVHYQFALAEGDVSGSGVAAIPRPVNDTLPGTNIPADVPALEVFADLVYFEPSSCGLLYYDLLRAFDPFTDSTGVALRPGEQGQVAVDDGSPSGSTQAAWTVRNVMSYHRSKQCAGRSHVWTQFVAWRPTAP